MFSGIGGSSLDHPMTGPKPAHLVCHRGSNDISLVTHHSVRRGATPAAATGLADSKGSATVKSIATATHPSHLSVRNDAEHDILLACSVHTRCGRGV